MCGSMVDIQSPTAEIRRGKKKKEEKIETTAVKYNGLPITMGGHNYRRSIEKNLIITPACTFRFKMISMLYADCFLLYLYQVTCTSGLKTHT